MTAQVATRVDVEQSAPAHRRLRTLLGPDWRLGHSFIAPTVILVAGLIIFPIISSVLLSTTERHGSESVFVGLKNYTALFDDSMFRAGVRNSAVFTVFSEVLKVGLGLIAALILNSMKRGAAIAAALLLLPWVIPTVVAAFTWRSLLDPVFGSVNTIMTATGIGPLLADLGFLPSWPAGWLSDPNLAMASVIWVNVWKGIPFFTVNFLAGLKAIDATLHEAAMVDGASIWQRFVHVTLPGLRNVLVVTTLLSTIWTFNNFDLVWLMTQGGPGNATAPYVLVAYNKAIQQLQFGPGSAVTLIMVPVVAVLVIILVRYLHRSSGASDETGSTSAVRSSRVRTLLLVAVGAALLIFLMATATQLLWRFVLIIGLLVLIAAAIGTGISTLATKGRVRGARFLQRAASSVALLALIALVVFPMYWIVVTAFKPTMQIVMHTSELWAQPWSTEQFASLLSNGSFPIWYRNTLIVSIVSTLIALVVASLGGYALARLRFRGANAITVIILLTYVMPGALLFIPLYRMFSAMHVVDSLWALIITYPTFTLPFATWLLTGYFRSIPVDLEEAALTDGCSRLQAFRLIVLPLAKPGLLAVSLFTLTNAWNEFLFAFVFITKDNLKTLPVGLQSMIFGDVVPQGQLAAASLLISVPVILMYAFGQRFLTDGLTAGAVKG
jgi:multiple sugar transport system permease protein